MAMKKQFKNFAEMLSESELPVLVDFYATWCGPCQMMVPVLQEVSAQMKGQVKVVKIDNDKYPDLASEHHIYALPTLVLFKNGKTIKRFEGFMPAERLISELTPLL